MNVVIRERGRWFFYLLFGIIPLLLWISTQGSQILFTNYYAVLTTAGKIAGIIGICFFACNLILSGRYKFLDRLFGGLDRVYLFHRQTGIATFIILTVHYAAMTLREWQTSWRDVWVFMIDLSNMPINYGRLGYFALLIVIVITLYVRLRYERLKFLHSFMGAFLFLGGLHAYLIPSDIAFNQYLRWYMLTVVVLSILSYLWRTVLRRLLLERIIADVTEVNRLGSSVTEVIMKPIGGKNTIFIPGQFIFVRFRQENFPYEDHPFSLTASSEEGRLRISAKELGDFTKVLSTLKPGAKAEIQGPYGGFSFLRSKKPRQIWIAGGIGITPFISMIRSLRDRINTEPELKRYDITLFYSVKNTAELIYKDEFESFVKLHSNFKFKPWVAETQGYITAGKIKAAASIADAEIYICGPKPLLKALTGQFRDLGVPKSDIHFELFSLLY